MEQEKLVRKFDNGIVYTAKQKGDDVIITGFDPILKDTEFNIRVGSQYKALNYDAGHYRVVKSIERRDHAGTFIDKAKQKDSFFTAVCGPIQ